MGGGGGGRERERAVPNGAPEVEMREVAQERQAPCEVADALDLEAVESAG